MDMRFMTKNFTPNQVKMFKDFNKHMETMVLSNEDIDNAQKSNVINFVADLLAALRSGLLWSSLKPEEIDLIKQNVHESRWKEFEKS